MNYKGLSLINGILIGLMLFFSGALSETIGKTVATFYFHLIGLGTLVILMPFFKDKFKRFAFYSGLVFLPGVLNVLITGLNVLAVPEIGLTFYMGLAMFGQLVASAFISEKGWLETPKMKLQKNHYLGMAVVLLGVICLAL